jgi:hypothetical protein
MFERLRGHKPELKFSGPKIIIKLEEKEYLVSAIADFLGKDSLFVEQYFPKQTNGSLEIPTKFSTSTNETCQFEVINNFTTNPSPFLRHIFTQLRPESGDCINKYLEMGGKIIMTQRTAPTEEFRKSYTTLSEEHHHGFDPVTELIIMNFLEKRRNGQRDVLTEEEKKIADLEILAGNTIKFYAIGPLPKDSSISLEEVNQAIAKLHEISDLHEFALAAALTRRRLLTTDILTTLGLTGLSFLLPYGLDQTTKKWGPLSSMVLSHLSGDAIDVIRATIDRYSQTKPDLRLFLAQLTFNFSNLEPKDQAKFIRNVKESFSAIATLMATVTTALTLSYVSQQTNNILPFLLIEPVCSWEVYIRELWSRTNHARELLQKRPELIQDITERYPQMLKLIAEKYPSLSLAVLDFIASNPVSFASWIGSHLTLLLLPLSNFVDKEVVFALSAVILPKLAGVVGGINATKTPPWDSFNNNFINS